MSTKKLGPVVMESIKYINLPTKITYLSLSHLYKNISNTNQIIDFFLEADQKFLCIITFCTVENKGNPSHMYLLAKTHKMPLKARAIISSNSSLCTSGIVKWLSVKLKKIICNM